MPYDNLSDEEINNVFVMLHLLTDQQRQEMVFKDIIENQKEDVPTLNIDSTTHPKSMEESKHAGLE